MPPFEFRQLGDRDYELWFPFASSNTPVGVTGLKPSYGCPVFSCDPTRTKEAQAVPHECRGGTDHFFVIVTAHTALAGIDPMLRLARAQLVASALSERADEFYAQVPAEWSEYQPLSDGGYPSMTFAMGDAFSQLRDDEELFRCNFRVTEVHPETRVLACGTAFAGLRLRTNLKFKARRFRYFLRQVADELVSKAEAACREPVGFNFH